MLRKISSCVSGRSEAVANNFGSTSFTSAGPSLERWYVLLSTMARISDRVSYFDATNSFVRTSSNSGCDGGFSG